MKRIIKILICFLLLILMPVRIHAGSDEYVKDDAGLLSQDEIQSLSEEAQQLSDQYGYGVYIRTVNDESSYDDIYTYTENYYTDNSLGYGETADGILFLIATSSQGGSYDIYIPGDVSEKMISIDGVGMISDHVKTYLQAHDYNKACESYLDNVSDQLSYYEENGTPQPYEEGSTESSGTLRYLLIFGLPLLVALIVVLVMLNMNRTKHKATTAKEYITKNGVHMNTIQDIFLYRTETRTPLPQNDNSSSSTFTSSSGGSHSGGHF